MKSTYSISSNITELENESAAIARQGFDIIDIKYNDGVLFSSYGNNIGKLNFVVSETTWRGEPTFEGFNQKVEELKADDYELTDVEITDDGYWLGTFANNQLESELVTATTLADFNRQVDDLQAEDASSVLGYQVVDIELAGGLSIGILDRNGSDAYYTFTRSFSEFTQEVAFQREEGLELTNIDYTDGLWTGVFTDDLTGLSEYSPQSYAALADFEAEIENFRDRGYDLINVESIEGEWFGIYKEDIYSDDSLSSPGTSEDIVPILRAGQVDGDVSVAIGNTFS